VGKKKEKNGFWGEREGSRCRKGAGSKKTGTLKHPTTKKAGGKKLTSTSPSVTCEKVGAEVALKFKWQGKAKPYFMVKGAPKKVAGNQN